jgi:hypothetical protein
MAMDWLQITCDLTVVDDPRIHLLRGGDARTSTGLFAQCARILELPAHFGHNWDALADALRDQPSPMTVVVHDAHHLLADERPDQLEIFLAVMDHATGPEQGLRLFLVTTLPYLDGLRSRVTDVLWS